MKESGINVTAVSGDTFPVDTVTARNHSDTSPNPPSARRCKVQDDPAGRPPTVTRSSDCIVSGQD